jgi:hypothetical protein
MTSIAEFGKFVRYTSVLLFIADRRFVGRLVGSASIRNSFNFWNTLGGSLRQVHEDRIATFTLNAGSKDSVNQDLFGYPTSSKQWVELILGYSPSAMSKLA